MHPSTAVDSYGDHQPPCTSVQAHRGGSMTDTRDAAVINEALAVIDKALSEMLRRELVSSGEVADVLLDVRTLLVNTGHPAES